MPYPKTAKKLSEFVEKLKQDPEIGPDLESTGTRLTVVQAELEARAEEIWHRASPQIGSYENLEESIDSAHREYHDNMPREPRWLELFRQAGGVLAGLVVLAVFAGIVFGLWKGWGFLRNAFLWEALLAASVALSFPVLLYVVGRRVFERHLAAADATLTNGLGLDTANKRLEAALEAANSAVEQTVFATTRAFLESRKGRFFGEELPGTKPDGLAQVLNSDYDIATESRGRVYRLIEILRGASIGIAGPRGAGKTTLMWSVYETGNAKKDVLSVFTSAPVEYEPRDFILHLFSAVCLRIVEKQIGRETASEAWKAFPESTTSGANPWTRMRTFGPAIAAIGTVLVTLGIWVATVKMNITAGEHAAASAPAKAGQPASQSNLQRFIKALDVAPAPLIEWGFVIAAAGFTLFYSSVYSLRARLRDARSFRGGKEEKLDALGKEARGLLSAIRFQQSYTSGWSGSFKLPVALEAGVKREESWSERQQTLPEIVSEFCDFLARATSKESPYAKVIVCIDELDKLDSDESAQRFLNGIKSIFNQPNCFYLISVSENAMSNFERRGLPFRDAFDSSFDEVVYIDYLDLDASKRLLARRVLNVPHPFLCFCHAIAGGLPRDLVRICRSLFESRDQSSGHNSLPEICASVMRSDIESKLRAINIAAQKLAPSPEAIRFREISAMKGIADANAVWNAIENLEAFLGMLASPEAQDDDSQKLAALATETAVFLYFAVTMLDVYTIIDEPLWRRGEDQHLFDQLAGIRRELARNQLVASKALAEVRIAFGMGPRRIRQAGAVIAA